MYGQFNQIAVAVGSGLKQASVYCLPAAQRPGEIPEIHAPSIVRKDGLYYMYYGPSPVRLATSPDLVIWTPQGAKSSEPEDARDPSVVLYQACFLQGARGI